MDFQERFKGRTSTISKVGIESVIGGNATPIKRDFNPSYSEYLNKHIEPPQLSVQLDNSPTMKRKTLPNLSAAPRQSNSATISFPAEVHTPKGHTYTPGTQIHPFQINHNYPMSISRTPDLSPDRERGGYRYQMGYPRERPNSLQDVLLKNPRGYSNTVTPQNATFDTIPTNYNPNNFYNQQTQMRVSQDNKQVTRLLSDANIAIIPKSNKNHLHRKNFETLNHQNKQRNLSGNVGRDLVSPGYVQSYSQSHYQETTTTPIKRYHEYNNANLSRSDRLGSHSPVKVITPMNQYTSVGSIEDESLLRGAPFLDKYAINEKKNSLYNGQQVMFMNRLKGRVSESVDLSGPYMRFDESRKQQTLRPEDLAALEQQMQNYSRQGSYQNFAGPGNGNGHYGEKNNEILIVHPPRKQGTRNVSKMVKAGN